MGYWNDLEQVLSGVSLRAEGAVSIGPGDALSLFKAVRFAIGVQPQDTDCADVAFWEWREMRSLLVQVWEALDRAASRRSDRREFASVWVHRQEQSGLNLDDFITEARSYAPTLPSLTVSRRPDAFLMVNVGKSDSVIVSTVAVIVKHSGLPYGEILHKLQVMGGPDEDLLGFLDSEVERLGADQSVCDQSAIPRELIRAKQKVRDQFSMSSMSVSSFLEVLNSSNNLTNINDDALLSRLLHIAPEENRSIAKKIETIRLTAT